MQCLVKEAVAVSIRNGFQLKSATVRPGDVSKPQAVAATRAERCSSTWHNSHLMPHPCCQQQQQPFANAVLVACGEVHSP